MCLPSCHRVLFHTDRSTPDSSYHPHLLCSSNQHLTPSFPHLESSVAAASEPAPLHALRPDWHALEGQEEVKEKRLHGAHHEVSRATKERLGASTPCKTI
ncbi:hypothetical protein E2C01_021218 [Portunus trituberculatus]|uniref:Uncharacterized protein n=1 Tax=Portunus trituberculatus TaxID=210409 RepID=A0A5B7E3T2_PORTR|nr:hypothetical protein [Portunus trituberculatus]